MTMKVVSALEGDLLHDQLPLVLNAEEAGVLIDRLDTTTIRYKMEIGTDKTKMTTNNKWLPERPR